MDRRLDGRRAGRVLSKAAADWVNLILLALSVITARWLGAWWPLLLGGAACATLVGVRLASPAFWRRALAPEPEHPRLPSPLRVLDPGLRATVTAIGAGRTEILRLVAETPEPMKPDVRFALATIDELERCAARLVTRAEILTGHLRTVRRESIRAEIGRLEERLAASTGEDARREYAYARAVREQQLHALDEIHATHERLVARLARVVALIEGLPSRILRIRALGVDAREDLFGEVDVRLERMTGELLVSEQALELLTEGSDEG